jgi:hypothetical protein
MDNCRSLKVILTQLRDNRAGHGKPALGMEQNHGPQDQLRVITEHARAAMTMMAAAGVPMTPENYAVFFAYAENRLSRLNAFIDRLFAEGRPFTPELCTAAHRRFLNTALGLEAVREANERLSRMLNTVRHDVGEACQITEDFGFVLKEHGAADARRPDRSGDPGDRGR